MAMHAYRLLPMLAVKIAIKHGEQLRELAKQAAAGGTFDPGVYLQLDKGQMFGSIPSQPQPLLAMLAGGLAGAGLGYGLGALGETVLPGSWQRRKLRRTLGLAGGLAGMSPGLAWGLTNLLAKRKFNDPHYAEGSREYKFEPWMDEAFGPVKASVDAALKAAAASPMADMTGLNAMPVIDVNRWNQLIWNDPRVAIPLTPLQQTAASGLITGAASLPGKPATRLVSPIDVGRMAAGMGSGYLSGVLVGKALGTLLGMPDDTQNRLRNTGAMAGLIANIVPLAMGA